MSRYIIYFEENLKRTIQQDGPVIANFLNGGNISISYFSNSYQGLIIQFHGDSSEFFRFGPTRGFDNRDKIRKILHSFLEQRLDKSRNIYMYIYNLEKKHFPKISINKKPKEIILADLFNIFKNINESTNFLLIK